MAIAVVLSIIVILCVVFAIHRQRQRLVQEIAEKGRRLSSIIKEDFLVQPCPRCQESAMRFLELSPHARSVHYQCVHCGKKMRAAAATPDASDSLSIWSSIAALVDRCNGISVSSPIVASVEFETAPAPLPYEQTTRTPIPERIRAEVWRRDGGRCVECGSQNNLQFDHMIPVSRGGATSAQNLQLLCQKCNRAKGARV
jgi:5-methylcytosine-specific restriction endonuclease McrA